MALSLDAAEFRAAYYELKFAGDGLDKDMRQGIKAAGDGALQAVREAASFSRRIPAATHLRVSFGARTAGVSVVTSAAAAPDARPINNAGREGTFRHPVFADQRLTRHSWTWVSQKAIPFFNAAKDSPEITKQIQEVLDNVAFHAGFK